MPPDFLPPLSSLSTNEELSRSGVVANNRMNRERRFVGENSYCNDLRLDLAGFLQDRLAAIDSSQLSTPDKSPSVDWLDLCCGRAFALRQAAEMFPARHRRPTLEILGLDLVVDSRDTPRIPRLTLVEAMLPKWQPSHDVDLVTCVHGLHYLGDKLAVIAQAARCLKPGGLFAAHLDPANLRHRNNARFGATVVRWLKQSGFEYHARFRRILCRGPRSLNVSWRYLGADDQAGPNCSGQPAVDSWYGDMEPTE